MAEKKRLDADKACQMLMSAIDADDFLDRVYEFAQNLCNEKIAEIESDHVVVDADGCPYDGSDGTEWYDDARDEFVQGVFERLKQD